MAEKRAYSWATILYPESCVGDISYALQDLKVPCALSPLHDEDINEDTGELKKPHYHALFHYTSLKSYAQAKEDVGKIGGVGVERVRDIAAYVRYLVHADNPDKVQYDRNQIKVFNGFVVAKYFDSNKISIDEGFVMLLNIAIENRYSDYGQLVTYCLKNNTELLCCCRKSAYALSTFLRSRCNRIDI